MLGIMLLKLVMLVLLRELGLLFLEMLFLVIILELILEQFNQLH